MRLSVADAASACQVAIAPSGPRQSDWRPCSHSPAAVPQDQRGTAGELDMDGLDGSGKVSRDLLVSFWPSVVLMIFSSTQP